MIYLDNSATTRVDRDAAAKAYELMTEGYGNPSSQYSLGMDAYQELIAARLQVSRMLSAPPNRVYFTSGGTESNNIAIRGTALARQAVGRHLVTTAIEHSSVLQCCAALEREGFQVTYVQPDAQTHTIRAADVVAAVRPDTVLVSTMHVNNETGEILPLEEIVAGVRARNPETKIHCDAVQSYGKLPFKLYEQQVDLLSASSHKIHGPKGVGLLYIREGCPIQPLEYGGSQEGRINPGTENVPAACAFGVAAAKKLTAMEQNLAYAAKLKGYLLRRLLAECPGVHINSPEHASPFVLNFSLPGQISSEIIDFLDLRDICVSAGSACAKGARSYTLEAMGYSEAVLDGALRIGLSEYNTIEELDCFIEALKAYLSLKN